MNHLNSHSDYIPQGWVFERLGNFANYKKGKKPETLSQQPSYKYQFPYVDIKAFEKGVIFNYTDGKNCVMCSENDFLMVWDGSRSGYVGKGIKGVVGSTLMKINLPALCNDFAFYFLQSKYLEINSRAKGTGTPHVDPDLLWKYLLPIPPLKEQHRIVEKIEELFSDLDKGIESLKTTQQQLKIYRQAVLKWAFEGHFTAKWREEKKQQGELKSAEELLDRIKAERAKRERTQLQEWHEAVKTWEANGKKGKKPGKPQKPKDVSPLSDGEIANLPKLPECWVWVRLGNTNVEVSDGPFGSNLKTIDYVDSGVRVIRLENIGVMKFLEEKESYVSYIKYELLKQYTVLPGDIVVASFITENVRVALFPPRLEKAINKSDCFRVRFFSDSLINNYVLMCLSAQYVYRQLEALVHGIGRPRINTTQLKNVTIPICCTAEQQIVVFEIESRLSICDRLEATITENLQRAESLRQSILKQAFEGKLVPQDPNDEPAEKLLERIRKEKLHGNDGKQLELEIFDP